MVNTLKGKIVYTGYLSGERVWSLAMSGDTHIQDNGVDLWTPQGDIRIIGCRLEALINPYANTALGDLGGIYCYAEVSLVARENEERSLIVRSNVAQDPLELPTIGEHALTFPASRVEQVMFPEGYGIDLDRWHPVYLNIGSRCFIAAGNFGCAANALIYYVER